MEARPGYPNRIFGRVAHGSDGALWLQYWLYYYFDKQGRFGSGVHEGDWEMVQVRIDAAGNPDLAAYAQHSGGERCVWSQVNKDATGRPIVYVAQSSHAAYFRADSYQDPTPDDDADGEGIDATPALEQIRSESPSWVAWPGRWGDSDESSPRGPRWQPGSKWADPSAWAGGLTACGGVS